MSLVTVEAVYRGGQVVLDEEPGNVAQGARVLVTFLPRNAGHSETPKERARLRAEAFEQMRAGVDLGGPPYPGREELHDRGR